MKLKKGKETIELTNEIQIRAYLSAGWAKEPEKGKKEKSERDGQ